MTDTVVSLESNEEKYDRIVPQIDIEVRLIDETVYQSIYIPRRKRND